jgi:hypothetical protein
MLGHQSFIKGPSWGREPAIITVNHGAEREPVAYLNSHISRYRAAVA